MKTSLVSGRISRETPVLFEAVALLDCYAAFVGGLLPTFWDNLSVPSSRCPLEMEITGRSETSATSYQQTQRNSKEERRLELHRVRSLRISLFWLE